MREQASTTIMASSPSPAKTEPQPLMSQSAGRPFFDFPVSVERYLHALLGWEKCDTHRRIREGDLSIVKIPEGFSLEVEVGESGGEELALVKTPAEEDVGEAKEELQETNRDHAGRASEEEDEPRTSTTSAADEVTSATTSGKQALLAQEDTTAGAARRSAREKQEGTNTNLPDWSSRRVLDARELIHCSAGEELAVWCESRTYDCHSGLEAYKRIVGVVGRDIPVILRPELVVFAVNKPFGLETDLSIRRPDRERRRGPKGGRESSWRTFGDKAPYPAEHRPPFPALRGITTERSGGGAGQGSGNDIDEEVLDTTRRRSYSLPCREPAPDMHSWLSLLAKSVADDDLEFFCSTKKCCSRGAQAHAPSLSLLSKEVYINCSDESDVVGSAAFGGFPFPPPHLLLRPIGRLDVKTTGLMLFAGGRDAGAFCAAMTEPGRIPKVYEARVRLRNKDEPTAAQLTQLLEGCDLTVYREHKRRKKEPMVETDQSNCAPAGGPDTRQGEGLGQETGRRPASHKNASGPGRTSAHDNFVYHDDDEEEDASSTGTAGASLYRAKFEKVEVLRRETKEFVGKPTVSKKKAMKKAVLATSGVDGVIPRLDGNAAQPPEVATGDGAASSTTQDLGCSRHESHYADLRVTIRSGQFHVVRRLLAHVDLPVQQLSRVGFGGTLFLEETQAPRPLEWPPPGPVREGPAQQESVSRRNEEPDPAKQRARSGAGGASPALSTPAVTLKLPPYGATRLTQTEIARMWREYSPEESVVAALKRR